MFRNGCCSAVTSASNSLAAALSARRALSGGALLLFLWSVRIVAGCLLFLEDRDGDTKKVTNEQRSARGSYQLRSSATLAITRSLLSTAPHLTCHEHVHENQHPCCTPHFTPHDAPTRGNPNRFHREVLMTRHIGARDPAAARSLIAFSPVAHCVSYRDEYQSPHFSQLPRLGGPAPAAVEIPTALADPKALACLLRRLRAASLSRWRERRIVLWSSLPQGNAKSGGRGRLWQPLNKRRGPSVNK